MSAGERFRARARRGHGRKATDHILLAELVQGKTLAEAAAAAGISAATAGRRLRSPKFARRLQELRDRVIDTAVAKLAVGASEATDKLLALIKSSDERIALAASRAVITQAVDVWRDENKALLDKLAKDIERLEKDR